MALIAAHLNAGRSGGDGVVIGTLPLPTPPYPLPPILPVPNKPYGFLDVKHHVHLLSITCNKSLASLLKDRIGEQYYIKSV